MKPIIDYYGTAITVQPLMGSQGPAVDLEFKGALHLVADPHGAVAVEDYFRLTPEQALDLADRLTKAAEGK